jgi:hypothetical protein
MRGTWCKEATIMRKLFLICLLTAITIIPIDGCERNDSDDIRSITTMRNPLESFDDDLSKANEAGDEYAKKLLELLSRASETNYDELLTKTDNFDRNYMSFRKGFLRSFVPRIEYNIEPYYAIECLRRNKHGFWYSIHRDRASNCLVYIFYEYEGSISHSIYAKKSLDKEDFKTIKIGSDISEVEIIDDVTTQWILKAANNNWKTFSAYHLLRDGLLVISYERAGNTNFKVSAIEFHEDYTVEETFGDMNMRFNFTILEQDYPK